ncbi:MAG: family 16 glycosylhydrolase, partial [Oscillospiraceae bacterium]|nr:family 16 glycosylhydrolase [Oscillospiraceae bacterium]
MKCKQTAAVALSLLMGSSAAGLTLHRMPIFAEDLPKIAVPGDVDASGTFDDRDVAMLQGWLHTTPDVTLADWQAGDLLADGVLDVFDLALMKRNLSQSPEMRLIWSDEFDGDTLDRTKWAYELGNWKLDAAGNYITNGWGNNEQEFYTDSNASVQDGVLTIAARQEAYSDPVQGDYAYTSARLSTQHLFSTCGGRIEVRARCDAGRSLWPAIWMLPEDSVYGGWAASGEIDIMEGWGSTPEKICGTIHFGDVWPNNTYLTNDFEFPAGDSTENYHTYAIEWESGEIRWYVDDTLYSTQNDWYSTNHAYPAPFDQNFYLILNLAVGGHFDGVDGIYADPATFADGERHFDIDYVRVYDLGDAFAPTAVTSLPLDSYIEGADAALSVTAVQGAQTETAIEGEREADANVAASYMFDIKVLDADGIEIQPAEGQTVSVAFSLEEVADENLDIQVYHISGSGSAEELAVTTTGQTATAAVGSMTSADSGTFKLDDETTVTAEISGTVSQLKAKEGDRVEKGGVIAVLKSSDLDDQIQSAKDSLRNAEISMENRRDQLDNYTITSPISGTIIDKYYKAGENTEMNKTLCTIYDLRDLTMTLSVDELDISNIAVGQKVQVTADAVAGKTFEGVVTKVSPVGTNS